MFSFLITMIFENFVKMNFLINDYVFLENICNLNCYYCHIKKISYQILNNKLVTDGKITDIEDILINTDNILKQQIEMIDSPILKISGGEISIIPEIISVIKKYDTQYDVIQVLTNNYFPAPNFYDTISLLKNIHIQVSLDGHLFEMNQYRFLNKIQFDNALKNLEILIQNYEFPLEINCVLTNINYKDIIGYIEWLSKFNRKDLKLNIFPVSHCKILFPPNECIPIFEEIISNYENYSSILPPRIYMKELLNFIMYGKRVSNCLVPYAVIGTYDTGKIDLCACSPELPSIGDISKSDFDKSKIISSCKALYNNILRPSPYHNSCIDCYTPYEILSLYFKGLISYNEIKSIPLYRGKKTLDRLELIKSNIFQLSTKKLLYTSDEG